MKPPGPHTSVESSSPSPPWLNTPRGRRDLFFIAAFLLANVLIPLLIVDLYPFSRAPMFADAPRQCCDYELFDNMHNPLPLVDFGLQRNYWGNPVGEGVGFRLPRTVDHFGAVADASAIEDHLIERLRERPDLPYVDVVQKVLGDAEGERIEVIQEKRWRVVNPAYQGRKSP